MKKADLEALVLAEARLARTEMIDNHGAFPQMAILIGHHDERQMIIIAGEPLHGQKMAATLTVFAKQMRGGADAILVMADCRGRDMSEAEIRGFQQGSIANDSRAQELLITGGRSREHSVGVFDYYRREPAPDGDVIVFETPEPQLSGGQVEAFLIPNIWERVN